MLYRVALESANLLRMSLVAAVAMLAISLLALVETTNTAQAEDSLPENGKIAYYDGANSIYVVNSDGTGRTNVTPNDASTSTNTAPAWSPDGTKIAFSSDMKPSRSALYPREIYVMDADGSHLSLVITGGDQPDLSPDGSKIAYRGEYSGQGYTDIYVANADGSNPVNLTGRIGDASREHVPAWSPDGTKIVFQRDQDEKGRYGIYAIDADGRNLRRLTNVPAMDSSPDWQPLPKPAPPKSRSETVHPPDTGGPSLLLVASSLLCSASVLLYAGVRRRM
jgi:Tol biopolymer transport system component